MLATLCNVWREYLAHHRDPEDVAKGVHFIDALGLLLGRGDETMLGRMRATERGRRLLAERHDVLELLADRERLRRLPPGSLGRCYLEFAESNGLYPEKLASAVEEARATSGGVVPRASEEVAYLHDRYRDLHDLWHVLTGYGVDMGGEMGLQGFQTQHTGYRGMAMASFVQVMRAVARGRPDVFALWLDGRRRSARVPYLLSQDWEALLARPLEQVQRELGLLPLPAYRRYDVPQGA